MRITYSIRADSQYFWSVIGRYYKQRPFLLHLPVQFGILGLISGALYARTSNPFDGGMVGVLVFTVGLLATWAGLMYRFKRGADFGSDFTIIASESGIEATGNHVHSVWKWSAYPRAVRFTDGILLLRRGVIRWLPDAAIQEGTAEQATSLIGSKSALKYVA